MNTNPVNTNPAVDLSDGSPVVLVLPGGPGVPDLQDDIGQDARQFSAHMERRRSPQPDAPRDDPMSGMTAALLATPLAAPVAVADAAPLTGPLSGTLIGKLAGAVGSQVSRSLPARSSLDRFADEVPDKVSNLRDEAGEAGAISQGASVQTQQGDAVDQFVSQRGGEPPPVTLSVPARNPAPVAGRSAVSGGENWPTQKAAAANDLNTGHDKLDAVATVMSVNPPNTALRTAGTSPGAQPAQPVKVPQVPVSREQVPRSVRSSMPVAGLGNVELGTHVDVSVLPAMSAAMRTASGQVLPATSGVSDASGLSVAAPLQTMQSLQAPSSGAALTPQAGEASAMLPRQAAVVMDAQVPVNDQAAGSRVIRAAPNAADATEATEATVAADAKAAAAQPVDAQGNAGAAAQPALTHAATALALTPGQMKARLQKRRAMGLDGGLQGRAAEPAQVFAVRPTQVWREKPLAAEAAAQAGGVVAAQPLLRPNTQELPEAGAALSAPVAHKAVALHSVSIEAGVMPAEAPEPAATTAAAITTAAAAATPSTVAREVLVPITARVISASSAAASFAPSGKALPLQVASAVVGVEAHAVPQKLVPEAALQLAPEFAPELAPELMPAASHDLPPEVADPAWSLTAEQQTEQTLAPAAAHAPDMPGAPPAPVRLEREMRVAEVAVAQAQAQELRLAVVNTPESQIEAALKAL